MIKILLLPSLIFLTSISLHNGVITESQYENIIKANKFNNIAIYYNKKNSNINIDSKLIAEIYQLTIIYAIDFYTFLALIEVESNFDATEISPTGAIGLCQITTVVEEEFGNKFDRHNKSDNLLLGAMFFSRLIHHYKYEIKNALIHYNAGTKPSLQAGGLVYANKVLDKRRRLLGYISNFL